MPETPRRRRHRRFLGPDPRRDVDEELAFHFSMRVEELQRAGLTAAEAEAAAARRFGNVRRVREECAELADRRAARQRRRFRLDALRRDVRFALRTVATHRGFAAVVALTIALGIGANSAVFSVAYGVLLRPLPFRDADALVRLWSRNAPRGVAFFSVSPADYADWRAQGRAFSAMAAFERQRDATLRRAGGGVESVQATAVTPDVFPLLGTPALRGRTLLAADARPDAPPVAVLGHALWVTRFGADPAVLGSVVTLDGTPHTVVGVMPPRFAVPGTPAELWTPLSLATASTDHSNRYLRVLARLAPGRTLAEGRAELDLVAARLARAHPATNAGWSVNVMSVPEMIVGTQFRQAVVALVGVVAVVLLIACANAANLLLARAAARRRELALRRALGATRGRLVTQLLTESVVLATIGGVAGLALAYAGVAILRAAGAGTVPRLEDVRLDTPVLVFTAAVTLGSAVLFGLLPSLRVSRADMGATLRTGGRGVGHDGIGQRLRGVLVVLQVSLSLVLLVGTGLLLRSLARLQGVPLGFEPRGVLVAPLQLPEAASGDSTRRAAFQTALLARVGSLPGVEHAALVSSAPFAGPNTGLVFAREDRPTVAREQAPDADLRVVTPGYFRTIGLRLLRGRDFTAADGPDAPGTVLVSEAAVRRYWPDRDPIGTRIHVGDVVAGPVFTVVGVVADARYQSLDTPEPRPMLYFSALAQPPSSSMLVVRGPRAAALADPVRRAVTSLDPTLPPPTVASLEALVAQATATSRFALTLFAIFGGTALLLVAVGIYGMMAYLVRQRTHELGVRIALGARPTALAASVVWRALALALLGIGLGLVGAWGLTRSLSALLFGVSPTDPPTFAAIALLLALVAVLASLIPARRATRADPLAALRVDG